MKVEMVDTVPKKVLTQDSATNAELGTEKRRENGYIIGVMAHLVTNKTETVVVRCSRHR